MQGSKKSKLKTSLAKGAAVALSTTVAVMPIASSPILAQEAKVNDGPTITVETQVIGLGMPFNASEGVLATDYKGLDISGLVKVDILTPEFVDNDGSFKEGVSGEFKVRYEVTDVYGKVSEKEVTHIVSENKPSITISQDKSLLFPVNHGNGSIGLTEILSGVKSVLQGVGGVILRELPVKSNIDQLDTTVAGDHIVQYKVEYGGGSVLLKEETLTVEDAKDIPKISAVLENVRVNFKEEDFDIMKGISAISSKGEDITDKVTYEGVVNVEVSGVYPVTYSVKEYSERYKTDVSAEVTVQYIVQDGEGPVIEAEDVTIEAGSSYKPLEGVYAVDAIDGPVAVELVSSDVIVGKPGSYSVEFRAKDKSGNETRKTIVVTVVDTTPPTVKYLGPDTFEYGETISYDSLFSITDNVDATKDIKVEVLEKVNTKKPGPQVIKIKVTDKSGNTQTYEFGVNVKEEDRPVVENKPPTITASNKKYSLGSNFDLLNGVTAYDPEDGEITDRVTVLSSNVDRSKIGTYSVTYSVTDSSGASATKTISITIFSDTPPTIKANDIHVVVGRAFNERIGLTSAYSVIDGDITSKVVARGFFDVSKPGEYPLTYSVRDSQGNYAETTVKVFVHSSEVGPTEDNKPVIFADNRQFVIGSKLSLLSGVAALDPVDGDISGSITVDHNIDIETEGVYQATYSVTNSSGMSNSKTIQVTVVTQAVADAQERENDNKEKEDISMSAKGLKVDSSNKVPAAIIAIPGVLALYTILRSMFKKETE